MDPQIDGMGALQWTVLRALWVHQPASVHEVIAAIQSERRPAYTTVLTVLRSLEKRGIVSHVEVEGSRQFRYRSLVAPDYIRDAAVRDLISTQFNGSSAALVKHLAEKEEITTDELNRICDELTSRHPSPNG